MNSLFDDLSEGLQQAIDYEKGIESAKTTTFYISPVKQYNKTEVRTIRLRAGMTQSVFADYMGVSKKTVEAWECGRTHPTGSACRLMEVLSNKDGLHLPFVHVR